MTLLSSYWLRTSTPLRLRLSLTHQRSAAALRRAAGRPYSLSHPKPQDAVRRSDALAPYPHPACKSAQKSRPENRAAYKATSSFGLPAGISTLLLKAGCRTSQGLFPPSLLIRTYSVSRCIIARIGIPVKGQNKKNSYKMRLRTGQQDPYDGGQTAAMP